MIIKYVLKMQQIIFRAGKTFLKISFLYILKSLCIFLMIILTPRLHNFRAFFTRIKNAERMLI